jgi:hypothetical protein
MVDLAHLDPHARAALLVIADDLTARRCWAGGPCITPMGRELSVVSLLRLAWMGYVERVADCWAVTPAGKARAAALVATDAAQLSLFDNL